MSNELKHYGVPGMKWGQRKDRRGGSITTTNTKRNYKNMSDEDLKRTNKRIKAEKEYRELKGIKTKDEQKNDTLSNVEEAASKAGDVGRNASNLANDISRLASGPSKKAREDMAKMSDAELRQRINRIQMEQQYGQMNPSAISRGASVAGNILSALGNTAMVAGSIAKLILAIRKLQGK